MEREKKQPESDKPPGAPLWMVTYSDCVTLMLTFFVLLFSFSSLDENVLAELSAAFSESLSAAKKDTSSFLPTKQIVSTGYFAEGSEKPTLTKGPEGNLEEDTESDDFHSRKVFLISSKKFFFGKGTIISSEGRNTLSTMASFLKDVPCRIVISETGPMDDDESEEFGLLRSWAVLEYFTSKQGLDKGRFSIATDTLQKDRRNDQRNHSQAKAKRWLEIVLLERSIYN